MFTDEDLAYIYEEALKSRIDNNKVYVIYDPGEREILTFKEEDPNKKISSEMRIYLLFDMQKDKLTNTLIKKARKKIETLDELYK